MIGTNDKGWHNRPRTAGDRPPRAAERGAERVGDDGLGVVGQEVADVDQYGGGIDGPLLSGRAGRWVAAPLAPFAGGAAVVSWPVLSPPPVPAAPADFFLDRIWPALDGRRRFLLCLC